MQRRLIEIIWNKNAGNCSQKKRNKSNVGKMKELFPKTVFVYETEDEEELWKAISEIKERGTKIVGVIGGDGTWSETVSSFIRGYIGAEKPAFLVLGGGTMNSFARYCTTGNPVQQVNDIINCLQAESVPKTFKVNLIEAGGVYGCLFGTGFVTEFLARYYQNKAGTIAAAKTIIGILSDYYLFGDKSAFKGKGRILTIAAKDRLTGMEGFNFIFAGTHDNVGLGFELLDCALKLDGEMRVYAGNLTPLSALENAARKMRKIPLRTGKAEFYDGSAGLLLIQSPHKSDYFDYTIDGDIYQARGSLEVRIGAEARIISPEVFDILKNPNTPWNHQKSKIFECAQKSVKDF